MKTIVQKIHIEPQSSFACRTYSTPHFETNWHVHEEFELILITEGSGTVMIGDYVGDYTTGDLYFIAGNLPHWFRKSNAKMIGSAKVLHCKPELLLTAFSNFPEMKHLQYFIAKKDAILLERKLKAEIAPMIEKIETGKGFQKLILLFQAIYKISVSNKYSVLTHDFIASENDIDPAIEEIIDYSFKHFLEPLSLSQIANVANMSIPSFCRFFKKNIKKTYFNFLQELRIGHACKLLNTTEKSILEICYNSGYNSWAHFSKQFKQVKGITPSQYRKQFEENN